MDTKTPLYILLGCNLANLLLDPVLIFGFGPIPALGTQGAAAATAVGEWGAAIAFLMQLQNRALLPPRPTLPKWDEVRAEREGEKAEAAAHVHTAAACPTSPLLPSGRPHKTSLTTRLGFGSLRTHSVVQPALRQPGGPNNSYSRTCVLTHSSCLSVCCKARSNHTAPASCVGAHGGSQQIPHQGHEAQPV